jgi:hypothetical protein
VKLIACERSTLVTGEKYIGLDVHQATISVAVMDASGKLVMESIQRSIRLSHWPETGFGEITSGRAP